MKKLIRLTESDLHNIVESAVKNLLSELDWRTYQSAYEKELNNPKHKGMRNMDFRQAATNAFNRQNGYGLQNIPYGDEYDDKMTPKPNSYVYGGGNKFTPDRADPFFTVSGYYDKNGNGTKMCSHQQIATRNRGDYQRGQTYDDRSDDLKNNARSFNPILKMRQERGDKQVRDYFNNKSHYVKGKGWQ